MTQFKIPDKLQLIHWDEDILHNSTEKFSFAEPQFDIVDFSIKLVKMMQENNALGLAAPQVGVPYRIFAMNAQPALVMINPKLVSTSEEESYLIEGCLSFPGLSAKIKRHAAIEGRVWHPNGLAKTYKFENLSAHVFLHELDHLDGKTFFDAADKFHLEKMKKDWKNLKRKYR